jgi:hypothetical protein
MLFVMLFGTGLTLKQRDGQILSLFPQFGNFHAERLLLTIFIPFLLSAFRTMPKP